MRLIKLALICLAVCMASCLTGCVTGVKYQDMKSSIATLNPDQGRIYFVRKDSMVGAALQPNIYLDKVVVGESKPGGFFYVDTNPGSHLVSTATEVENHVTFALDAGETKYIRTSTSLGLLVGHVSPELISAEDAMQDLQEAKYTGTIAIPGQPGQVAVTNTNQPVTPPTYVETVPVAAYSSPAPVANAEPAPMPATAPQQEIAPSRPQPAPTVNVIRYSQPNTLDNAAVVSNNGKVDFRLGVSSNTVERMGKQRGCESKLGAGLISANGPTETYLMSCNDGSTYLAKCELRQCVPM